MTEKTPLPNLAQVTEEISQALSKRRQARSLSLDEISHVLKIRVPILKALEEGHWDQVPEGVYLENFIKKYAQYLGLDPQKTIEPFLNAKKDKIQNQESKEAAFNWSENASKLYLVVGVCGVLVLIVVIKLFSSKTMGGRNESAIKETTSSTKTETKSENPDGIKKSSGLLHKVQIHSPYPLWIHMESEDKPFEGFIPQGSTWNWNAKGQFSIRFGHTKEVHMFVDGQRVQLLDNQKQFDLPNAN